MSKNILVLLGHPDTDSFCGALAEHYQQAAVDAGHTVERVDLATLTFDPVLHHGYKEEQPLEPDLVTLQESISRADHIVLIYPNWWCAMPAKLKGLFDRAWLPGFAFDYNESNQPKPLLSGKTARIIITLGHDSPFRHWWKYGDYTNEVQHGIFGYAGISAAVKPLGPCEHVGEAVREHWLREVAALGHSGK